jgi:hypothetical protein
MGLDFEKLDILHLRASNVGLDFVYAAKSGGCQAGFHPKPAEDISLGLSGRLTYCPIFSILFVHKLLKFTELFSKV